MPSNDPKYTSGKKLSSPRKRPSTAGRPPAGGGGSGDTVRASEYERAGLKAWSEGQQKSAEDLLLEALRHHPEPEKAVLRYPFQAIPALAERAYQLLNSAAVRKSEKFPADLAELMVDFGYLTPVRPLVHMIAGKDVLDFGCGGGLMGPAFLICGARSYTGVDLQADLTQRKARNKRLRRTMQFPYSPSELARMIPRMRVRTGDDAALGPDDSFDIVTMLMVTEHLMELEAILKKLVQVIRPNGMLYFSHHNYYCWNGHHMKPRTVDQIDVNDPDQKALYDWNHVIHKPAQGHYSATHLNQVRIHELRHLVEKYYCIQDWKSIPTDERRGATRLTPAIRAQLDGYSEEDLLTQAIRCTAIPR